MRNHLIALLAVSLCVAVCAPARADIDVEGTVLIGTGVDTGGEPHNPYALQVGGQVELILWGVVLGARATRALALSDELSKDVDLRAIGGDLGYEWELWIFHIGPRLGLGYLSTVKKDLFSSFYVEPGVVGEIELGWFAVGADLRYRVVTEDMDRNGFLAYAKIGLRF